MVLLPMCGVQSGRSRIFPVMKRREMHVIARLRADLGEQGAVHPVYDGPIHFTGSSKHLAVVVKFRNKDVLDLKVAARVQQRHGIEETFQRTGAQMESLVQNSFTNEIFEQRRFHARWQWRIED